MNQMNNYANIKPADRDTWEVPAMEVPLWQGKKHAYCVVIPVINEGDRIRNLLKRMQACQIAAIADIIVVDGGSTDGSMELEALKHLDVNGLVVKKGPGKLSAQLRCAYAFALDQGYEGIVTIDGNDKDDPDAIPKFIDALKDGVDFVQASRFISGGVAENTPKSRDFAIRYIHAPALALSSGFSWTDTTQGFRAYSRNMLLDPAVAPFRDIFSEYELLAYLSHRVPQLNYRCLEIATVRRYPKGEVPTKISVIKGNWKVLRTLADACLGNYNANRTSQERISNSVLAYLIFTLGILCSAITISDHWKKSQQRKSSNIVILFGATGLLLIASLYLLSGEYAYCDDNNFVVQGYLPSLHFWLAIGRPGTWAYFTFINEGLQSNLFIARLMGLFFAGFATVSAYFALSRRGHRPVVSIAFALSILACLPILLAIVWINTASSLIAVILAIAAYAIGVTSKPRFALSVLFASLSCLVYQPAACIFFSLYFLDWVFLRRERASVRDLVPFIVGGLGLIATFVTTKVSIALFTEVDKGWSSRGALLHDIAPKWEAITNGILPFSLNPLFPYIANLGWISACIFAAVAIAGVIYVWRKAPSGLLWTSAVAIGYLIAAELPVLIVQETWPSYRTFIPWCTLAITFFALAVAALVRRFETIAPALAAAVVIAIGLANVLTVRHYLIDTEVAQTNEFTRQVSSGVKAGYKNFGIVLAPAGPYDERFGTYEFGWISASYDWTPGGMLNMAEARLGLQHNSLHIAFASRKEEACSDCYIVDMRPIWQAFFDKYTLERRRAVERKAIGK